MVKSLFDQLSDNSAWVDFLALAKSVGWSTVEAWKVWRRESDPWEILSQFIDTHRKAGR